MYQDVSTEVSEARKNISSESVAREEREVWGWDARSARAYEPLH